MVKGIGATALAQARAAVAALLRQQDRWFLWLPVAMGMAIAIYFSLPTEPPLWSAIVIFFAAGGAAIVLRGRSLPFFAASLALAAATAGFAAVAWRTQSVAAPVLSRDIGPVLVSGRIVLAETTPQAWRVTLDRVTIEDVATDQTPAQVRLRVNKADGPLAVGSTLSVLARLGPPGAPSLPGGFDFQRYAFFRQLGGIGFALGEARVTPDETQQAGWQDRVETLRQQIAQRIQAGIPGPEGAVAAAMFTGVDSAIPKDVSQAMRDSGLAHLLTISGLHFGFVAAMLFFLLRAGLALWPRIALRYPTKKWAAFLALIGTGFYLALSGADVPAVRSYIMIAIVLLAVLVNRSAFTLRLVALAATGILLFRPESLINPSFQLSFAAVTALIAYYEGRRHDKTGTRDRNIAGRVAAYGGDLAVGSLIAGSATAPFAWYHFGRLSAYGMAANMLAIPLTGFWIMPWGLLALILMPFGLEHYALVPMGWGISLLLAIAHWVASWPGAATQWPSLPLWALCASTLGGLWVCFWRGKIRWLGAGIIVASIASALLTTHPPDILVAEGAKLVALRDAAGNLVFSNRRGARRAAESWLQEEGQNERPLFSDFQADGHWRLACDDIGCIYQALGRRVVIAWRAEELAEDCHDADLVISAVPTRKQCRDARYIIDLFDLNREGAYAIWLDGDPLRVETVRQYRGSRPWVLSQDTKANKVAPAD